jgi:uncharacterized protein YjbI with pentapeptide repeats
MKVGSRRAALLGAAGAVILVAALSVVAQSAHAASTCPSVNASTGAVSPAPGYAANWSGCDLAGADLQSAGLQSANLTGANLTGANLTMADLNQATIAGASFTGANLAGVYGSEVVGKPSSLPAKWLVVVTTDATNRTLEYLIGPTANIPGAGLFGVDLAGADLSQLNIMNGSLANTNLSGTDLSDADLGRVQSGGVTGQPAALPAGWFALDGNLLGPTADAAGADLAGADLTGYDLRGIDFTQADLAGADLAGLDLDSVNFQHANFDGANLSDTNLDAYLVGANLTAANLTGATITSANLLAVTWLHTTCPDGSDSDAYVDGCLSARDTAAPTDSPAVTWYTSPVTVTWHWTDNGTIVPAQCPATSTSTGQGNPVTLSASCTDLAGNSSQDSDQVKVDTTGPAVTVTGVSAGHTYLAGADPRPGCTTTDRVSGVAVQATLKVSPAGAQVPAAYTATCAGGVDQAGNDQAGPARAAYTVGYGVGGFLAPTAGATVPRSARTIKVTFRLTVASGRPVAARLAAALGQHGTVRAALSGPGIARQWATCAWNAKQQAFRCGITIPRGVRTGKKNAYSVSAWEKVTGGPVKAPATGGGANPIVIHFS